MPIPTTDQIRRALDRLSTAALADVIPLLQAADPRTALVDNLLPALAPYADAAGALGADYYDELRDAANLDDVFEATPVVDLDEERLRRAGLWAAEPMYQQPVLDPTLAASRLSSVVQPTVVNPFRDTITANQLIDPKAVGYRRTASNGCRFCVMLASRGAVYRNSAHFASHPHCHCTATPVFAGGAEGPEASVLQYVASQRRRTPAQQRALRRHLDSMPEPPRLGAGGNPLQPELGDDIADTATARAVRRPKHTTGEVDDVAAEFGVTADEVQAARAEVAHLRRRIRDEAAGQSAESFAILDGADALALRAPGRNYRGGEFDWLERLDPQELARLRGRRRGGRWFSTETQNTVDEVAERLRDMLGGALNNMTDDEVMRTVWLHHTRRIEAAGAIRRGKIPTPRQYSGSIDVRDFAPGVEADGFDVALILGSDDLRVAGHIAQVHANQWADEAARLLDSYRTDLGPAPWEMSFDAWEAEVRDLEYARDGLLGGDARGLTDDQARRRLAELIPPELDGDGFSYEDAYAAVVTTARVADYPVPVHAVVEWI